MNTEVQEFKKEAESAYHEIGHVFFAYYHKLFQIDEVRIFTKQEAIEQGPNPDCRGVTVPCTPINEPYYSWMDCVDNGYANLCVKEEGFLEFAHKYYDYCLGGWYGEKFYHDIVLGMTESIGQKGNHSDYNICDNLERQPWFVKKDKYDILKEYKDTVIKLANELINKQTLYKAYIESVMREAKLLV